jgi:hypothetical protein
LSSHAFPRQAFFLKKKKTKPVAGWADLGLSPICFTGWGRKKEKKIRKMGEAVEKAQSKHQRAFLIVLGQMAG